MSFITEQEAIEHVEGFDALSASDKANTFRWLKLIY